MKKTSYIFLGLTSLSSTLLLLSCGNNTSNPIQNNAGSNKKGTSNKVDEQTNDGSNKKGSSNKTDEKINDGSNKKGTSNKADVKTNNGSNKKGTSNKVDEQTNDGSNKKGSSNKTDEKTNDSSNKEDKQANKENGVFYKNAANLKEDDYWWNLNNINYSTKTSKGIGSQFYSDFTKNNNSYKVLNLRDWYKTYDTDLANVFSDPNHQYNPKAPKRYDSGTKNYKDIYFNDSSTTRTKTGNNNNGFNGIYSGTHFWIENDHGSHYSKKYDVNTIESYNGQGVVLRNANKVSNGWEHVSPWSKEAEAFGWKGNRKNSTGIQLLDWSTGDLHNLRPSIQNQFNSPRSNNLYGMVPDNNVKYPGIDFEIGSSDFKLNVCEPRISVRGDVARITLYMHDRYHLNYDYDYYRLLLLWARMDPVTKEEKELDKKIKDIMGFSNDYVTGVKQLPYDQEVEKKVIEANKDKSINKNNPGIATRVQSSS